MHEIEGYKKENNKTGMKPGTRKLIIRTIKRIDCVLSFQGSLDFKKEKKYDYHIMLP